MPVRIWLFGFGTGKMKPKLSLNEREKMKNQYPTLIPPDVTALNFNADRDGPAETCQH